MVHASHAVLFASLLAAVGCVLVARAASPSSLPATEPAILMVEDAEAFEEMMTPEEDGSAVPLEDGSHDADGSGDADGGATGLFANNKIRIQDSRIVLTAHDRAQLLRSIAHALIADQKKRLAAVTAASPSKLLASMPTPLVSLSRDAFLYLEEPGNVTAAATAALPVARIGWRYPLAVWSTYKAFITTEGCGVQRVIGDYFYC